MFLGLYTLTQNYRQKECTCVYSCEEAWQARGCVHVGKHPGEKTTKDKTTWWYICRALAASLLYSPSVGSADQTYTGTGDGKGEATAFWKRGQKIPQQTELASCSSCLSSSYQQTTHITVSMEQRRASHPYFKRKKTKKLPLLDSAWINLLFFSALRRLHRPSNKSYVCWVPCCISTELPPQGH